MFNDYLIFFIEKKCLFYSRITSFVIHCFLFIEFFAFFCAYQIGIHHAFNEYYFNRHFQQLFYFFLQQIACFFLLLYYHKMKCVNFNQCFCFIATKSNERMSMNKCGQSLHSIFHQVIFNIRKLSLFCLQSCEKKNYHFVFIQNFFDPGPGL